MHIKLNFNVVLAVVFIAIVNNAPIIITLVIITVIMIIKMIMKNINNTGT